MLKSLSQPSEIRRKAGTNYDDLTFSGDGTTVFATGQTFGDKSWNSEVYRLNLNDRKIRAVEFYNAQFMMPLANGGVRVSGERRRNQEWSDPDKFEISVDGRVVISSDQASDLVSLDGRFTISRNVRDNLDNFVENAFRIDDRLLNRSIISKARNATPEYLRSVDTDASAKSTARVVRSFNSDTGEVVAGVALSTAFEKLNSVAGQLHRSKDGNAYILIGGPNYSEKADENSKDLGDIRVYSRETGIRKCSSSERSTWRSRDNWQSKKKAAERGKIGSFAWSAELDLGFVWTENGIVSVDVNCETRQRIRVSHSTNYRWKVSPKLFEFNKNAKPLFHEGVTLTGDGRRLLAWRAEPAVQAIDPETGQVVATYKTGIDGVKPSGISPEDFKFLEGRPEQVLVERVLSIPGTTQFLVFANGGFSAGDMNTVGIIQLFDENQVSRRSAYIEAEFRDWAVSRSGKYLAILSSYGAVKIVDPSNGRLVVSLSGDLVYNSIGFSEDGNRLYAFSADGYMRVFDPENGRLLVSTLVFEDGEWITLTPEGFFSASKGGAEELKVRVRGLELVPLDRAYDALYRPDLVREALAGDPNGKVSAAAAELDLGKVIASGFPPRVSLISPEGGATLTGDGFGSNVVDVEVEIEATSGGIGKVEWSVNGVLQDLSERALSLMVLADGVAATGTTGETKRITQSLYLASGENEISVVAYNAAGLIAADPLTFSVTLDEPQITDPKLYVLSVGVNDYFDSRLDLAYAASDARAVGSAFTIAGKEIYSDVIVETVLDDAVTKEGLEAAFKRLQTQVRPGDVFLFFLAGHGKTEDGRYYFLPHDFRYTDENSFKTAGIGQTTLQEWFAKIRAQKSVLLFDTCESGTLTQQPGVRGTEALAAISRLNRAIGRTTLTASTDTAPALEGFRGHGVFTYTLLDAIASADNDNDQDVDVTEIASYIDRRLPEYSEAAFGYTQVPQMKVVGNSFPIARATVVLSDEPSEIIPKIPTHVVIQAADVFAEAVEGGAVVMKLQPGTSVRLMSSDNGWVLIAKDGEEIGYVAENTMIQLQ